MERYFKELESGARRMSEDDSGKPEDPNPENLDPTMSNVEEGEKKHMKISSSHCNVMNDMKEIDPLVLLHFVYIINSTSIFWF